MFMCNELYDHKLRGHAKKMNFLFLIYRERFLNRLSEIGAKVRNNYETRITKSIFFSKRYDFLFLFVLIFLFLPFTHGFLGSFLLFSLCFLSFPLRFLLFSLFLISSFGVRF